MVKVSAGYLVSLSPISCGPHQRWAVPQGLVGISPPALRPYPRRDLRDLPGRQGLAAIGPGWADSPHRRVDWTRHLRQKGRTLSTTQNSPPRVDERVMLLEQDTHAKDGAFVPPLREGEYGSVLRVARVSSRRAAIPEGPPVWICGDCHVGNLGPLSDKAGRVRIHIRDLDQTVIGNPAHDLVRLALSLASAARGSDLPGVDDGLHARGDHGRL